MSSAMDLEAEVDQKTPMLDHHNEHSYLNDPSTLATAQARPLPETWKWQALEQRGALGCILMHAGLVLAHIGLLVVALNRWEDRITVAVGQSSARLQTYLTIGSSSFGVVRTVLCSIDYEL
jgi:hypothetical protein